MKDKRLLTRRNLILAGAAAAGGLVIPWWWKRRMPPELPPTYGHLLRMGDNFTYATHRLLLPQHALARVYHPDEITPIPAVFISDPRKPEHPMSNKAYRRMEANGFANWRLSVEGEVEKPRKYSLADLKKMTSQTQITKHTCEEGWSAIAKWTGVQLRHFLDDAGVKDGARFVTFHCYDKYVDSIDMIDATHPQTLLAYGMNDRDLTLPHGAPVRLRLETQMGYKSMKYLTRIVVTRELQDGGEKGNIQNGWSWYAGI